MALINCSECGREISDKAEACPGCGAPVSASVKEDDTPSTVEYDRDTDSFAGTMVLMVKLAMRAVQELGWRIDQANESIGLVTFQTKISWGSWSGVLCSLNIEETSPNTFSVTGTGKQNIAGGQFVAFNIAGEAESKAHKAIEKMREIAVSQRHHSAHGTGTETDDPRITQNADGTFSVHSRTYKSLDSAKAYLELIGES